MQSRDIRETYNTIVPGKFESDYEYNRWFKDEGLRAGYEMTKQTIERYCLPQTPYHAYLEAGPGPGTWTKLFLERQPTAQYHLVDISKEMITLARQSLVMYRNRTVIEWHESDFVDFSAKDKFDFFFSSRAIEYMPDKDAVVATIAALLQPGARGCIITKTPRYYGYLLTGRRVGRMHTGQIAPRALRRLLRTTGFTEVRLYPATISVPFLKSPLVNRLTYRIFGGYRLNWLSRLLSESYCITFVRS